MVAVALPFGGGVIGFFVDVAETPGGNALTLNSTGELKPFSLVTVRVVDTLPPSLTVSEDGETDMVKFFVPEVELTVRVMVVL
jgi:hypothetical protein